MPEPTRNRIVIYRMKESFSIDDLNMEDLGWDMHHSSDGLWLYTQRKEKPPAWQGYLSSYLSSDIPLGNMNASFLLFKQHADRVYALAGGSGWHKLKAHCEQDFGLQVALRMIDDKSISTMQQRNLKGATLQVFRTVKDYDPAIDSENYNRILKHIQGKASFEGRRFSVSGRTNLVLRTERSIENLDEVLNDVEELLQQEEKISMPKSFKVVTDDEAIEILEEELFNSFISFWNGEGDRDNMFLEFDEPLEQAQAARFVVKFKRVNIELDDFDLALLRDRLIEAGECDGGHVYHKFRAEALNDDGYVVARVKSIHQAMSFECDIGGVSYLKIGNDWLEILDDVKSFINEKIAGLTVVDSQLPVWVKANHPREEDFLRYCVESDPSFTLMDQDFIYIEGRSKIELCDLYKAEERSFIHVKRTWGSQSSYLYLQAQVSAVSFAEQRPVRESASVKWPEHFDGNGVNGHKVVIALAAPVSKLVNFPNNLTYFAKLALHNATASIRESGYQVELLKVELEE